MGLTPERLREMLDYNQETGVFTWRVRSAHRVHVGDVAGCICGKYASVHLLGKRYWAHRLAWLYVYGRWPTAQIDHINGNRTDNRISNLRDVSRVVNCQNQRLAHKNNRSSGLLGASRDEDGKKWKAQIRFGGKRLHLGSYDTAEAAHAAYISAKRKLHEGCTV